VATLPVRGVTNDVQRANVVTDRVSSRRTTSSGHRRLDGRRVASRRGPDLDCGHSIAPSTGFKTRACATQAHPPKRGLEAGGVTGVGGRQGGAPLTYLAPFDWSSFWTFKAFKPTDITRIFDGIIWPMACVF